VFNPVLSRVEQEPMEEIDGIEVDLSLLPTELESCVPLIRRFAVSDDRVRSERQEAATTEELDQLAALSKTQWQALKDFLDRHMDDQPGSNEQDLALVLSAFGEAAAEALVARDR
jgi:hypothetical protein